MVADAVTTILVKVRVQMKTSEEDGDLVDLEAALNGGEI